MKSIFKVLTVSAVVLAMTACEDFLTKTPETNLAPENFFSSEKELELWTNYEYNTLLDDATSYAEVRGDDYIGRSLSAIQKGTRTNATTGLWSQGHWGYLRHINQFFENCSNCKNEEVRTKFEGVEHFFRARIMEVNGDTTGVIHFLTFVTDTCAGSLFEVCQYFFDCFVFVLLAEGIFCSEDRCWN